MAKVYLSSTYEDLVVFRDEICKTLRQMGHQVISMEDYPAADERPLQKCRQDVADCDVYIGVFAWRYGYIPRGEDRSITELEYEEAERTGKNPLVFLLKDNAPWPVPMIDQDRSKIDRLRTRVQQDRIVKFFSSAEGLARDVAAAVSRLFPPLPPGPIPIPEPDRRYYSEILSRIVAHLRARIRVYLIACGALIPVGPSLGYLIGQQLPEFWWGSLLFGALLPTTALALFPLYYVESNRKMAFLETLLAELRAVAPAKEAVVAVKHYVALLEKEVG